MKRLPGDEVIIKLLTKKRLGGDVQKEVLFPN